MGLTPIVRVHSAVLAGADPVIMLTAPIPATEKALWRSGLALSDIGVFEVNEAFATVPLAWLAETGADPKRLNPHGGAIALGHPLGGSGARLMTTMIHHMRNTRRVTDCRPCVRAVDKRTPPSSIFSDPPVSTAVILAEPSREDRPSRSTFSGGRMCER